MQPKSSAISAQHHVERVKKAREAFRMKRLAPETTEKSPAGPPKTLLKHRALHRVKFVESEWKKVVVVKADSKNSADVRDLTSSFDKIKV